MNELLLGFDVPADPRMTLRVVWNRSERDNFLLRPEVEQPISVDRGICPSIFQPSGCRTKDVEIPGWPESEINMLGFWGDLQGMLHWLEENPGVQKLTRFPIAVSVRLSGSTNFNAYRSAISASPTNPAEVLKEWPRLGYDVADPGQTSALSNCAYKANEIVEARSRWASHVNQSGLLDDLEAALAFREFSDARVPDHRPFYVYELFEIQRNGSI
jgi:hypothetical protein